MTNVPQPRTQAFNDFQSRFDNTVRMAQIFGGEGNKAIIVAIQGFFPNLSDNEVLDLIRGETFEEDLRARFSGSAEDRQFLEELANLARFGTETAPSTLLITYVTSFETFLEDLILSIYIAKPETVVALTPRYREKPTLLRQRLKQEAHNRIQTRWTNIFTDTFRKLFVWPNGKLPEDETQPPAEAMLSKVNTSLAEIDKAKAVRNIFVHNKGIVNKEFLDRVPNSGLQEGDTFPNPIIYLLDLKDKLYFTALGLDILAVAAYPKAVDVSL